MATTTTPPTVVSSPPDLCAFLSSITASSKLYIDLEGENLSRTGTLLIMTILVVHPPPPPPRAAAATTYYLIDIQTLGNLAFTTSPSNNTTTLPNTKTLKAILEDPSIPKYFWDVRNDADALFAHHCVRLAGVVDVQLFENASRRGNKTYLRGLDICVEKDLRLKFTELHRWLRTKREVKRLMNSDVFARRPLDAKTMGYCVGDVAYLPALYDLYVKRVNAAWKEKAVEESARRVIEACSSGYQPHGEKKRLGPWGKKEVVMVDEKEKGKGKNLLSMEE